MSKILGNIYINSTLLVASVEYTYRSFIAIVFRTILLVRFGDCGNISFFDKNICQFFFIFMLLFVEKTPELVLKKLLKLSDGFFVESCTPLE